MSKRKAFALVSVGLGHLDFGGMGYLKLVQEIRNQGVDIIWLTYGRAMAQKLNRLNEPFKFLVSLRSLWTPRANHIFADGKTPNKDLLMHIKHFELFLKHEKPDFLLIDRVFPFATTVADHLDIPNYVVGSPGGSWKVKNYTFKPGYCDLSSAIMDGLSKRLHYNIPEANAYARSAYMNITFIPRSFYSDEVIDSTSRFVNLFTETPYIEKDRQFVGVSFGNTEHDGFIIELLPEIISHFGEEYVRIYCPKTHKSNEALAKMGLKHEHWVTFDDELPKLKRLIYFGGISTTWYCLQYRVPMMVASSQLDDQDYNAERVASTKVGLSLNKSDSFLEQVSSLDYNSTVEEIKKKTSTECFTHKLKTLSQMLAKGL